MDGRDSDDGEVEPMGQDCWIESCGFPRVEGSVFCELHDRVQRDAAVARARWER